MPIGRQSNPLHPKPKPAVTGETLDRKLTDEQVKNWRSVLVSMIGPYALIASREEIQGIRDRMQAEMVVRAERIKEGDDEVASS